MRCVNTCASTDGARRAQNCAMFASVCVVVFMPLFAMCSSMFKLCVRMYAVWRSHLCIVNVREYEVQDTFPLHPPCQVVPSPSNSCSQRRSKFRHHLLRDANASDSLFVPGSRRCRLGQNLRVHHRKMSGRCSRANSISRFQRSSWFRFRILRHATTDALLLTMCSPVPVVETEPATVHPVHSEFLLWSGSLVWLD